MQNTQLSELRQIIDGYLLRLYQDQTGILPPIHTVQELLLLTQIEGTFEAIKYTNQLYHVLKDLLSLDHVVHSKITKVDKSSVTIQYTRIYQHKIGPTAKVEETKVLTYPPKEAFLWQGKSMEELNQTTPSIEVSKLNDLYGTQAVAELSNAMNTKQIKANLDRLFGPVMNPLCVKTGFKEFVEGLGGMKPKKLEPKKLEDLFKNSESFNVAIQLLRDSDSPLIGKNNNFLNSKKYLFRAWIDALDFHGVITTNKNKIWASLANKYFNGLDISERALNRASNQNYYNEYLTKFKDDFSIRYQLS